MYQQQAPANTTVILLAAGHGTRMLPLTKTTPKPLLKVGEYALIEHHIYRLAKMGFQHIVINTAYLGDKIRSFLGNGERYKVSIDYSDESQTGALETAGGIKKSLGLMRSDWFISINADIFTDFDFAKLLDEKPIKQACLVLVDNPEHNPDGDFSIRNSAQRKTYSGIALYNKSLFEALPKGKIALGPILKGLVEDDKLSLLLHNGGWTDVGTPERLEQLNAIYETKSVYK